MSERTPFQFSLRTLLVVTTVVALLAIVAKLLGDVERLDYVVEKVGYPLVIAMTGMAAGYFSATRSQVQPSRRYWALLLSAPNWLLFLTVWITFSNTGFGHGQIMKSDFFEGLESFSQNHGFTVLAVLFQIALVIAATQSVAKVTVTGFAITIFWGTVICVTLADLAFECAGSFSLP